MREWQVGDPIGDGNDIGVPDIPYMDYLKEDESYEDELVDDFKRHFNNARKSYRKNDYEDAFFYLNYAFRIFGKMSNSSKSKVKDKPFDRYWITETCSKVINNNSKFKREATDFILNNRPAVKACMDCDCIYPYDYKCCIKCGKPLTQSNIASPERTAEQLRISLSNRFYDEYEISRVIDRTIVLIKSNDCYLTEIEDKNYGIDFTFLKEHRYFKTKYVCEHVRGSVRVFEEFGAIHNYDELFENVSFRKLIIDTENKTGFTFKECRGGYGSQLDDNRFDFIFNEEVNVMAIFDMGDGKTAIYDLDLDNMQLSKDYRVY